MKMNRQVRAKHRTLDAAVTGHPENPVSLAAHAMLRHRSGMVGLVVILFLLVIALLATTLAPYDPLEMRSADRFQAPSASHLFGADEFGRDILSRILVGSRISFGVGAISVSMAFTIGIALGLMTGWRAGSWIDTASMRLCDTILAFPAVLLAIVIMAVLGPGAFNAMLAVAVVNIPAFARLTRGNVLSEKEKAYVEAARCIGASPARILFRGILPNVMPTVLVHITVSFASAVLLEASLSFLGLGTPLPAPSWGSMLSVGRGYLLIAPWYGIAPGLAITLLVMGAYLVGDGLRDVLDPRRQKLV